MEHRSGEGMETLEEFHACSRDWFDDALGQPTAAQQQAWPPIRRGESTLLVAPTGSGKTLAAFFCFLDGLMFQEPSAHRGVRLLYVSPLKALANDIEHNLRAPLRGIEERARCSGVSFQTVRTAVRSGDTPARERERIRRDPPEILITTPESLYLMLTSRAREIFSDVDAVIIDEIHAVVPTKRGSHLFLSLERLEALRRDARTARGLSPGRMQRIGLSATQRPLSTVARLLGGVSVRGDVVEPREVTIVDAAHRKPLSLSVEVPAQDPAVPFDVGGSSQGKEGLVQRSGAGRLDVQSIWARAIPCVVAHIRAHRSSIVFVNSRGGAERLAAAINETAGEELARAHHGSLSHEARRVVENQLKEGSLRSIVATASLELGIDMGAVDLVILVEAPPSVASGLQRVGRACHQVGGVPEGVIFPKYPSDLLACATLTHAMRQGHIETSCFLENPLDVLAQQLVAMVAVERVHVDELYDRVRCAACFSELPRPLFEGVLDMLSGRYPSDDFSDLRARITWDRRSGQVTARKGAAAVAIINGGTIPERGLYGVFLAGNEGDKPKRVGELDEEMVFESQVGDVFLLGASSWRVEEITHDRVLVSPAPGEPGRLPFWHGDGLGRPLEFGQQIGALTRQLSEMPDSRAISLLCEKHALKAEAAGQLLSYLRRQQTEAELCSDRQIVVERFLDEIGDYRICVLSPFGARVHAPWAMAVRAHFMERLGLELDVSWSDDGIVFRLSEGDAPPPLSDFVPAAPELEERIASRLAESSLFAARFRENAGRALLLTKRRPGVRAPLWALRRRSATLLAVAARFRDFPIVLETYRECMKDVFDMDGLRRILSDVSAGKIRVIERETNVASPFAAALMYDFVAQFMYDTDAPLAERRAQALTIDPDRLRQLMGDAALSDLLDADVIREVGEQLQLQHRRLIDADDLHDLLLSIGPLFESELVRRYDDGADLAHQKESLHSQGRIVAVQTPGGRMIAAAEDASRLRDALGVPLPQGLPDTFLEPVAEPLIDLLHRYARTHGPFEESAIVERFCISAGRIRPALDVLEARGQLARGQFLHSGQRAQLCDREVLRRIKRLSLSKLRDQVQAVPSQALARFAIAWHRLGSYELPKSSERGPGFLSELIPLVFRQGPGRVPTEFSRQEALLAVIERLQGLPFSAQVLEKEILPSRVSGYTPGDLDSLCLSGEVLWQGVSQVGSGDARIALFLREDFPLLQRRAPTLVGPKFDAIRDALAAGGGLFFRDLSAMLGGFPQDLLDALWDLANNGEVSNDTLTPLRRLGTGRKRERQRSRLMSRTARRALPGSEGRFWLTATADIGDHDETERRAQLVRSLLTRHGIVCRELMSIEEISGGYSAVYGILKALEERGLVSRGYFVEGLTATQFAAKGAESQLRDHRNPPSVLGVSVLSSTDPANLYGSVIAWPQDLKVRAERAPGARVILENGVLVGFLSRSERHLGTCSFDAVDPELSRMMSLVAGLALILKSSSSASLLLESIDGQPARESRMADALCHAGFRRTAKGLLLRREVG